jgi:hypothetical protein
MKKQNNTGSHLHGGLVPYETSGSRPILTNMVEILMFCEGLVYLWLDVIKICCLSAIFANQTFNIASLPQSIFHGFATV